MTTTLKLVILPLLLTLSCSCLPHQKVDITRNTRWQDAPDLKILEGIVRFQPQLDFGDGSKELAKLSLDFTFENQGTKFIKRVDFDVIVYNSTTQTAGDSTAKDLKIKRFVYDHVLSPNETGAMSVDWTDWDVTLPVRQTVRVARVLYEDGTVWERRVRESQKE